VYKGIIDTSILLRFLTKDSPEKREKFKRLIRDTVKENGLLLIPLMVVIELVYVLEKIYRLPKWEVREKVESLETLPAVEIESGKIVLEALRIYTEENLKFGDAMILAKSRVSGIIPVYTFDRDFKRFPEADVL
jgi:predicted nucleic-acid-binding protein